MKTEIRVLTRRENRREHHETLLEIDWSGATLEQLRTIAQWAIVHEAQAQMSKAEQNPPERLKLKVTELIHQPAPLILQKYSPPPVKVTFDKGIEDALSAMSEEEKRQLLSLLV